MPPGSKSYIYTKASFISYKKEEFGSISIIDN